MFKIALKDGRVAALVIGLAPLLLIGCAADGQEATVMVGRPQIFSRERLVQERFREYQWAEDQLAHTDSAGLQGVIDGRMMESFVNRLGIAVQPGAYGDTPNPPEAEESEEDTTAPAGAAARDADALREKLNPTPAEVAAADQPLASGREGELTRASLTPIQDFHDKLAYRDAVNAQMRQQLLDDAHDLTGYTLYDLQFDVTILPEDGNNRFAVVELTLQDVEPEETEDLYQSWVTSFASHLGVETLTLLERFLAGQVENYPTDLQRGLLRALVVEEGVQEVLKILQVSQLLGSTAPDTDGTPIFDLSPDEVQNRIAVDKATAEAIAGRFSLMSTEVGERLEEPAFVPTWHFPFIKAREPVEVEAAVAEESMRESEQNTEILTRVLGWMRGGTMPEKARPQIMTAINLTHRRIYAQLGENGSQRPIIQWEPMQIQIADETITLFLPASLEDCGAWNFLQRLKEDGDNASPFIVSVSPKEYAQNISDISSRSSATTLAMLLAARLPNVDLSNEMEYRRESQEYLQAIRRSPLAIGFSNGENKFGWVLGPAFKIDKEKNDEGKNDVAFEHVPARHTVHAAVAVPAWAGELKLTATLRWLNEDNGQLEAPKGGEELWKGEEVILKLPHDVAAITDALVAKLGTSRRPPLLHALTTGRDTDFRNYTVLQAGEKATLALRGHHLWRNPQVMLGHQAADRVDLMPNMNGLIATFDPVQSVPSLDGSGQRVDIAVETTYGRDVLAGAALILPADQQDLGNLVQWAGENHAVLLGGDEPSRTLRFQVDTLRFPEAFHSIQVVMLDKRTGEPIPGSPFEVTADPVATQADQIAVTLPEATVNAVTFPKLVRVEVQMRPTSSAAWQSIIEQPVVLALLQGAKMPPVVLSRTEVTLEGEDLADVVLSKPQMEDAILDVVYSGFNKAWQGGDFSVKLTPGTPDSDQVPLGLEFAGDGDGDRQWKLTNLKDFIEKLDPGTEGKAVTVTLYYPRAANEPSRVEASGKLTLKKGE